MDPEYTTRIQKWVALDNIITKNKSVVSENESRVQNAVQEKKQIEKEIVEYAENNNWINVTLDIAGGKIKFSKRTQQQSLSFTFLKNCLEEYGDKYPEEKIDVIKICDHIKNSLEKKVVYSMKRDFDKN